ncbi:MAG: DUF5076 domain-containing protein [Phycisphaerales bacterium]|nr:MAG: DUF5076 domain-containing protein [Phycisphaerales bacterium]
MSTNDALPIPDAAKEDPKSLELIRIWIAKGDQEVILRPDVWEAGALGDHALRSHAAPRERVRGEPWVQPGEDVRADQGDAGSGVRLADG